MKTKTRNSAILRMAYAAVCLALCMVLPFLTGQIPQIGSALSPMHIPVLLAGFLCDTTYSENTVLFTVTFPIVGFCAGAASEFWLNRSFPAYLATAGAAILAVGLCQMVRVVFLDPGAFLHCLLIVLAQNIWSLPMAAVVYYPVRWVNRTWTSE